MLRVLTRLQTRVHLATHRDRGATAVEYALMVGFIATVIASAVALFGQAVADLFIVPASAF